MISVMSITTQQRRWREETLMSTPPVAAPPHDPRLPLGFRNGSSTFLIALVGLMIANLVPLIITVLSEELGLGILVSGQVITWSLLAAAVVGLATARATAGRHRRRVAVLGLGLAVVAFGIAAFVPGAVVAGLIAGGAGTGAAISSSGAAIAALRDPNRMGALSGLINRVLIMVILAVIPLIGLERLTVFGALTLFSLIGLLLAAWLPAAPTAAEPAPVTVSLQIGSPRRVTMAGIALLIVFPLWGTSEDAIWSMAGTLADQSGLSPEGIGWTLSAAAAGGAVGTLLITIFGHYLGRSVPLAVTLIVGGVLKLSIGLANDPAVLSALIIAVNTVYAVTFVLFVATAAGLDARGRWSGPLLGAYLVGSSFAPTIGALFTETLGQAAFGGAMALVSLVVLVPAVVIARVSLAAEKALARQSVPREES